MALELQSIKILTHELFFFQDVFFYATVCKNVTRIHFLGYNCLKNKYDNTSKGCAIFNLRLDSHQNHSVAIKILD